MKKVIIISLLMLLIASHASAGLVPCGLKEDDPDQAGDQTAPCTLCHLFVMTEGIIRTMLIKIIPPVAVLFAVIGGAYFILGSGFSPSLINKARSLFASVAMGLLIIYGSWIAINMFLTIIGVSTWTGLTKWWQISCSI